MGLRHFILTATLLLLLPHAAARVLGCQCRARHPPCAEYAESDAVFVGTVTEVMADDPRSAAKAVGQYSPAFERVSFRLERPFRGVEGESVEVIDWMTSCRYGFRPGARYLVYARFDPETRTLSTHVCSRTSEVSKASADLAYLNGLASAPRETLITGLLADGERRLRGVRVTAENGGGLYRAATNADGWFKLAVPKPGRYTVRIFLPLDAAVAGPSDLVERVGAAQRTRGHYVVLYAVEAREGGCSFLDVPLFISPRR